MKTDRLIGILTVLLQKGKVTAPYLAEKFEVSRRTINRDIEALCKAGVPVVTLQGRVGGIAIAEGYQIDRTLFTQEELRAVFAGLSGLNSVAQDKKVENLMEKIFPGGAEGRASGHILIDLSSYYKSTLAPKIAILQSAIDNLRVVEYSYCSAAGERQVSLEPYFLVFQWSDWYVLGRDQKCEDFRLFKLNRLWALRITQRRYEAREVPEERLDFRRCFTDEIQAVLRFDPCVKYRLIEEYGPDSFTCLPDGRLQLEVPFTNLEYLLEWVLSFGDKAELVEPRVLRDQLAGRLKKMLGRYVES